MGDYKNLSVNEILKKLNRYSFDDKINSLRDFSKEILINGKQIVKNEILPWELDSFLYLILYSNEKNIQHHIPSKQWTKDFTNILNSIRMDTDNTININSGIEDIYNTYSLQQIDYQTREIYFEIYRANYVFNCKEMKKLFRDNFKTTYSQIANLCFLLYYLLKENISQEDINFLIDKYKSAIKVITIDKNSFIEQDKRINPEIKYYNFCFKLFKLYLFIQHNGRIYMPLPHNIKYVCSDFLFNYLTTQSGVKAIDDENRKFLGESLEKYLYHILTLYYNKKNILKEFEYEKNREKVRSADCLVIHDSYVLMFDSKSSIPSTGLYVNNEIKKCDKIRQYIENINQMYKKINDYEFYQASKKLPSIEKNNIYAIIVLLQDSFFIKNKIYEEYFNIKKIDVKSDEAKYIKKHIIFIDIKDLEKYLFYGYNVYLGILDMNSKDNNGRLPHISNYSEEKHVLNHLVAKFIEKKSNIVIKQIEELQKNSSS